MSTPRFDARSFCPVCGGKGIIFDRRRLTKWMHQNFLCESCGMVWVFPQKPKNVYQAFYRGQYTRDVYGLDQHEKAQDVLAWRTRRSLEKIGYAKGFWKKGMCVLEVGAGTGAFLAALRKKFGCRVWGIEPAVAFVSLAREMLYISLYQGTFASWTKKRPGAFPKKFDRIVLDQVLEHILDPLDFLSRVRTLLTTQGALFISVPNIAEPKEPRGKFFIFEHVSSFSPFPLALLLLRAGYKVTGLYPEHPGSLQVTAAPFSSHAPSVPWNEIGLPLSSEDIKRKFVALD